MNKSTWPLLAAIIILSYSRINAQSPVKKADSAKTDSLGKPGIPKPFNKVITKDAKSYKGLFTVHEFTTPAGSKFLFEIPDSLLGRDILVVNRLSKAPVDNHPGEKGGDMIGYAGDLANQTMIRIEKGPGHKLFIRSLSYSINTDSSSVLYQSITRSNVQPITHALDIKTYGSRSSVVDFAPFIDRDDRLFSFGNKVKEKLELGSIKPDRSYLLSVHAFADNLEIKAVKTYDRIAKGKIELGQQVSDESSLVSTLEMNTSILLLARTPMRPRFADARVGYFTTGKQDYDSDPQGSGIIQMVTRWRLEPKKADMARYLRGELVEPAKPIIFYIDPATPKQWVPYLIQGVNDWQPAFEKAGFKNAIMALEAPDKKTNPDWSLENSRYSAIVYKPSTIANASGPHIHDPRSGEILESHVNWYHDVMKLLFRWYAVQGAASDTAARHPRFSNELMGQLIRFVSSHEIGHTLGLRHNFGASFATPVEKMRDKAWVEKHGHTASIMDYARFNYVAQPEDKVGPKGIFPRINDYDTWAIEWAYRYYNLDREKEKSLLKNLVTRKVSNQRLQFISGETFANNDPRAQREDLGDNSVVASEYGIKNLKFIMNNIQQWMIEKDEDYSKLGNIYTEVFNQYLKYIRHVLANIGGVYINTRLAGEQGPRAELVPRERQKQAVEFLGVHLLRNPGWLLPTKGFLSENISARRDLSSTVAVMIFPSLFNNDRLEQLAVVPEGGAPVYTLREYLQDLHTQFWSELADGSPIDRYRRVLQGMYVAQLVEFAYPGPGAATATKGILSGNSGLNVPIQLTDAPIVAKQLLKTLQTQIAQGREKINDPASLLHLEHLSERIEAAMEKAKAR